MKQGYTKRRSSVGVEGVEGRWLLNGRHSTPSGWRVREMEAGDVE